MCFVITQLIKTIAWFETVQSKALLFVILYIKQHNEMDKIVHVKRIQLQLVCSLTRILINITI